MHYRLLLLSIAILSAACSSREPSTATQLRAALASTNWLAQQELIANDIADHALLSDTISRLQQAAAALPASEFPQRNLETQFRWTAIVSEQIGATAFSLGGGVIVLSKDFLAALSSEAELAAVLSHEMAHQFLGHNRKALANAIAEQKNKSQHTRKHNAQPLAHFSAKDELAADKMSLRILSAANYDPRHALRVFALNYRIAGGKVAETQSEIVKERAVALRSQISSLPDFRPVTRNTRRFTKFRSQFLH